MITDIHTTADITVQSETNKLVHPEASRAI